MEFTSTITPIFIQDQESKANLQVRIYPLGPWHMDATNSIFLDMGDLDRHKVLNANVVIHSDTQIQDTIQFYNYAYISGAGAVLSSGDISIGFYATDNLIQISRRLGGYYDNVLFDSDVVNRGYLTLWVLEDDIE